MGADHPVILLVSNAADATADFFEERLRARSVDYVRLNTEESDRLPFEFRVENGVISGGFEGKDRRTGFEEATSVYYRRPKPAELASSLDPAIRFWMQNEHRRAWGGALVAAPDIRWVNHPIAIGGAGYKPEQLARAARFGLSVPDTLVTSDPSAASRFCIARDWNVVVKPVGHGEIRGGQPESDMLVYTNVLDASHSDTIEQVRSCPTLFQSHIRKSHDLRITIVGSQCIAVALHSQENSWSEIDCRRNNMLRMRYSIAPLPIDLVQTLVELTASYRLFYAAIDMVVDVDGRYWFLELNAAGQWAWLEQEIEAPISDALIRCLTGVQL